MSPSRHTFYRLLAALQAKDGKWLPWILDLGVKDRNTLIRGFELSQSEVSDLKQASARRKHYIAHRRHQSKKALSMAVNAFGQTR